MPLPTTRQAAIVGVGVSEFEFRASTRSPLAYAAQALRAALEDAGLQRHDVDGIVTNIGSPLGVDYDRLAPGLGLTTRFAAQTWLHGRFVGPCLQHAVMAVATGLTDVAACLVGLSFSGLGMMGGGEDVEALRQGGGSHGEVPHYGMTSPGAGAAMAAQLYFSRYGGGPEQLAAIPMAFRRHAQRNPQAVMTKPMSLDDYLAQPYVVEPLRRPDFSLMSDGGACVLVGAADRVSDSPRPPVFVGGMQGTKGGPGEFIFSRPGLGVWQQPVEDVIEDHAVYAMAGVSPEDVDTLHVYDAFSPNVLFSLERFGFVEPGEALSWVQGGRIELGGDLPMNTAGGLLSEAHVSGWNHIVEMVRQLRGEAGERQVIGCEVAQWATPFGDSLILHC